MIANIVQVPVYALGGIDARTAKRVADARLSGLAAIGALAVQDQRR
jgi:thiamine monophosphate synthase